MKKCSRRFSFSQIVEMARPEAAETAWRRARAASGLRHVLRRAGNNAGARTFSTVKLNAIRLAVALAPERIRVRPSEQGHLLSVRYCGMSSLHVPCGTFATPE
jgi:hypothetical protein